MADLLLFLTVCATSVWCAAPRVFRMADTGYTRRRCESTRHPVPVPRVTTQQHNATIDQFFDALARSVRSHIPARDALVLNSSLIPHTSPWTSFCDEINGTTPLPLLLAQLHRAGDNSASLFAMTFAHDTFHPDALEIAAHIVREQRHLNHSLTSSVAHAHLTIRILSALPFVVIAISAFVSSHLRSYITSPAFIFVITFGVVLNRIGSWWVSLLIQKATQKHTSSQSIALMESLCVTVQSGHTLVECCMLWQHINNLGAQVAHLLYEGASLFDSLRPMFTTNDPFDALVANTLVSAQHDGLPIRSTATLLASEARKIQRSEIDIRIRQLPTRLSLPLVLCILPSFALLVIAPLLITHLSQLGLFLPSPIS